MSNRYVKSSAIIPEVIYMKFFCTNFITKHNLRGLGATLAILSEDLTKRFQKYLDDTNLINATFLDPRFKHYLFKNEPKESLRDIEEIEERLLNECVKRLEKQAEEQTKSSEDEMAAISVTEDPDDPGDSFSGFDSPKKKFRNWAFKKLFEVDEGTSNLSNNTASTNTSFNRIDIQREIEKYKSITKLDEKEDPMKWWKDNSIIFPCLSILAQKYLSCPPSSVESERVFSGGGNIYTPNRNRIIPEMGERLMFLHFNLRLMPKLKYKLPKKK